MGQTGNGPRRWWRPGGETLEAIAGVLPERWRAAARLAPRQFWHGPARYLKSTPFTRSPDALPHHFTTGGKLIR